MGPRNKKSSNKDGGFTCGLLSDDTNPLRKQQKPSLDDEQQASFYQVDSQVNSPFDIPITRTPRPSSLTLPFQNRQRESRLVTDAEIREIARRNGLLNISSLPSHRSGLGLGINLGQPSSGVSDNFASNNGRANEFERQRPASMYISRPNQRFDIDTGKPLPATSAPIRDPTLTALPNPPTMCDLAVYPEPDYESDSHDNNADYRRRPVSRDRVDIYAAMTDDNLYESINSPNARAMRAPPPTRVTSPDDNNGRADGKGHKRKFSHVMTNMVESMKKRMKRPESSNLSHATTVAATPASRAEDHYEDFTVASENFAPSPTFNTDSEFNDNRRVLTHEEGQAEINRIMYGTPSGPRSRSPYEEAKDSNVASTSYVDDYGNTRVSSTSTVIVNPQILSTTRNDTLMDIDTTTTVKSTSESVTHSNLFKDTWAAVKNLKHKQYNPFAPLFAPKEPEWIMHDPPSHQADSTLVTASTSGVLAPPSPSQLLTPLPAPWQTLPRPVLASEIARLERRVMELVGKEESNLREIEALRGRIGRMQVGGRGEERAGRRLGWVGVGGAAVGVGAGVGGGGGRVGGGGGEGAEEEERRKTWMTVEE